MNVVNKEFESLILLKDLADQREQLQAILEKYQVEDPEQIKTLIRAEEVPEHPAYEDYLSTLAFQNAIAEMKPLAKQLIEDL
ncbi:MAG TPA: hypothetical protein VKK79_08320 [Candidatus Lokiarchaeia archaeon]|nr:hypothetical protein [Candidatus Lokiarchaeia archaeon]